MMGRREKNVTSYWMTFMKTRGYWKLKEEALLSLREKVALEKTKDLS
jgi:hypothetical protein